MAIRELTPWVARQAADALRPSVPAATAEAVYGRWPDKPALHAAIALAILDPNEGTRASALLGKSKYQHARISQAHREEIAARYLAEAADCRHAQMATFYINALTDLGPDQYPKARAAIDEIFSWGQAPGVLRRPMSDVPPDFLSEAVATALRSLRHDPGYFMPQRGGGRTNTHGGRERVFEEVLALADPARTQDLASVLAEIEDMIGLLSNCRGPDGTYDTSDPGELPDFAYEHGWLTALQAWAEDLEAAAEG